MTVKDVTQGVQFSRGIFMRMVLSFAEQYSTVTKSLLKPRAKAADPELEPRRRRRVAVAGQ